MQYNMSPITPLDMQYFRELGFIYNRSLYYLNLYKIYLRTTLDEQIYLDFNNK